MADRLPTSDTVARETRDAHPIYRYALDGWRCHGCGWSGADRDLHMVEAGVEAGIAAMARLREQIDAPATTADYGHLHNGQCLVDGCDRGPNPIPGPMYRDGSTVEVGHQWPVRIDTSGHPIIPNTVAALLCHPAAPAALAALLGVRRG